MQAGRVELIVRRGIPILAKGGAVDLPVPAARGVYMLEFRVDDMKESHCIDAITKAVLAADHNAVLEFDLPRHLVRVMNAQDVAALEGAMRDAGYTPVLTRA